MGIVVVVVAMIMLVVAARMELVVTVVVQVDASMDFDELIRTAVVEGHVTASRVEIVAVNGATSGEHHSLDCESP